MIYTIQSIAPICKSLHTAGYKLTLATGFFDLLHQEHTQFLEKAKQYGDNLIVAVESDARARALKGECRPIENQQIRCQKVKKYADYVIALGSDFNNFAAYDSLMSAVKPDVYAVSSHSEHLKSKSFLAEKYGGQLVVVHQYNPNISTTKIIANNQNKV